VSIALTVVGTPTAKEITFSWTNPAGTIGHQYLVDGKLVSNDNSPTKAKITFGIHDTAEHVYQVVAVGTLAAGTAQWPAVTPPPPSGWTVAKPGSTGVKVTTINNPANVGVNVYQAKATITDTIVNGGQDQAFLTQGGQGGGAGSLFERIQGNAVGGYSVAHNNKHFFYIKAANVTVLDAAATAATSPHQGDGGLSVRYGGFLGQRVTLDGFQLPLCGFADDETPGTVTFRQIATNGGDYWFDVDEAAKWVYSLIFDQVAKIDPGNSKFVSVNTSVFAAQITIMGGCTNNGTPVTQELAEELIHGYPSRLDMSNETRRTKLPAGCITVIEPV